VCIEIDPIDYHSVGGATISWLVEQIRLSENL